MRRGTGEVTDFTKLNFQVSRTQTLFQPWSGASVALMGWLAGQWSDQILPPAEQFYLGGSQFTRGYYSGQVPGDKALAATVELQLNTGTDLTVWGLSANVSTQFYLFYDWGETWQNQSTDFATKVTSAGGGVRAQVTRYTEVDLEALARFNRYPDGDIGHQRLGAERRSGCTGGCWGGSERNATRSATEWPHGRQGNVRWPRRDANRT